MKSVCNGGTKAPPYNAPLTHLRWELPKRGAFRKKLPRRENAIIHNRLRVTLSGAQRSRSFATQEQNQGAKRRRGLLTIFRVTSEQARKLAKTPRCGVFCFSPLFLQFFSDFQKKILTNRKNCIILYKKVEAHRLMSMQSYQRLPRRRSQKGSVAEDGTRQSTDLAGGIKSPTVVAVMRRAIQKTNTRSGVLCLFW